MVKRGPQLVQLMNGYPNRRSAGSQSSRRQSAQVAVSADTRVRRGPADWLAAMAKDADRCGVTALVVTRSILASGGASRSSRSRKSLTVAGRPLDLDEHAVQVVADEPAEAQPGRQGVHERAEADALDDPLHPNRRSDKLAHRRFRLQHRRITSRPVTGFGPAST